MFLIFLFFKAIFYNFFGWNIEKKWAGIKKKWAGIKYLGLELIFFHWKLVFSFFVFFPKISFFWHFFRLELKNISAGIKKFGWKEIFRAGFNFFLIKNWSFLFLFFLLELDNLTIWQLNNLKKNGLEFKKEWAGIKYFGLELNILGWI